MAIVTEGGLVGRDDLIALELPPLPHEALGPV